MATQKELEELRQLEADRLASLPESVLQEIEKVKGMSLEELQAACNLPFAREESIRSNREALLSHAIYALQHGMTLELMKLGYNPAKGEP